MKKLLLITGIMLIGSTWVKAQAQEVSPPNGLSEIAAYSLFYENYKNKQYEQALKYGRWILLTMTEKIENYPPFSLPTNLGRFVTIYSNLAENTADPELKAGYIDTVQMIYTRVFNKYSKDEINYYDWYLSKGLFYQTHVDYIDKDAKAIAAKTFKKAFALKPEKMVTASNGYYIKVLLKNLSNKESDKAKQEALAIISKAEPYANEDLREFFDDIRKQLFDEPAERIAFLESELQENPQDVNTLRQLRNLYKRQGKVQKVQSINQKLYELDPSYQTITALANFAIGHGNYSEAINYLKEALNKTDDPKKEKIIYLNLANAALNLNNLAQAQNYAKEAINIDPNWGKSYLKLAVIYGRAVNNCTNGRELTAGDRAVYWVVLDYAIKAKRVDPSVTNRANTLIGTYRSVTPTEQDIFFSDALQKGQTITIDASEGSCYAWINETTTVR